MFCKLYGMKKFITFFILNLLCSNINLLAQEYTLKAIRNYESEIFNLNQKVIPKMVLLLGFIFLNKKISSISMNVSLLLFLFPTNGVIKGWIVPL